MHFEIIVILKFILKIYILFTLIHCVFKNNKHKLLLLILGLNFLNILLTDILMLLNCKIAINNNIYIIISFSLWLILLKKVNYFKNLSYILIGFIVFSIINLAFFELYNKLNTKTFVLGTFLYLLIFVKICSDKLDQEDLTFFLNNNFILLSSPILFFVGYSFMFGFDNKIINNIEVFNGVKLFDITSNFVNFTFYTLINFYIFKEKKLQCITSQ